MRSLTDNFLEALTFSQADAATLRKLGESKGRQQLFAHQFPEQLETHKVAAQVESVESSNRIEGVIATRSAIKKLVLKDATPKDRTEQELSLIHI